MAQIKKFQNPAGPIEETVKKKYGKIYKNGTPYEVTDDTLGWLRSQSGVGIEIANKLENGTDQYITVDADGVGTIHNMSMPNSGLNYRQKRRLTKKPGILGGLFESGAVDSAREYIQRISDQNYQSFIKDPEKYNLSRLELDYNVENKDGNVIYTLSSFSNANREALLRLKELEQNGFIIPEGKTWDDKVSLSVMQDYAKQMPEGLIDRLKTHSLTGDDIDFLSLFNIIYKKPEKTDKGENIEEITEEHKKSKEQTDWRNQHLIGLGLDPNDKDVKKLFDNVEFVDEETIRFPNEWKSIFGNGYVFTKNDKKFSPLSGYIYIDGEIKRFDDVKNDPNVTQFTEYYNHGDYENAKKLFGFELPNIYSSDLPQIKKYSGLYDTWMGESGVPYGSFYYFADNNSDVYYLYSDPEFHSSLYNWKKLTKPTSNSTSDFGTMIDTNVWEGPISIDNKNYSNHSQFKITRGDVARNATFLFDKNNNTLGVWEEDPYKNSNIISQITLPKNWTTENISNFVKYVKNANITKDAKKYSNVLSWAIIQELVDAIERGELKIKLKNGGVIDTIKKFQNGNLITVENTDRRETSKYTDVGSPTIKRVFNGDLTSHDIADLVSLATDIGSYATAFGKSKGALYTSLGLGTLSSLAYLYANSRDGLGWNDVGNAALNLGLTGLQYTNLNARKSKILNTFNKISKWAQPLLFGFGLSNGYQGLSNIIEKIKDDRIDEITKAEVDAVYQGIKALVGIGQNISDVRVRNKYFVDAKAQKIEANKVDPLAKIPDEHKKAVQKYVVDAFLKQNNNEPGFIIGADGSKHPTRWFDAETSTVRPDMYDEAYTGLREGLGNTSFTPSVIRKLSLEMPGLSVTDKVAVKTERAKEVGKSFVQKGKTVGKNALEVASWGINPDKYVLDMSKIEDATKLAGPTVRSLERFYYANPENYVEVPEILKVRANAKQPKIMPTEQPKTAEVPTPKPAPEVPKQQVETAVETQVPVSKTTVLEPDPSVAPVKQQIAVQQSLFDQNKSPLSLDAIFPFRHANNYELKLPVKVSINAPELTPKLIGASIKGEPVYHYDLKLGNTVIATYDQFGNLKTQISPRDLSQIEIKRSGGRIQKAWGGAAILEKYYKDFDNSRLTANDKKRLEDYGKEGTDIYNLYGNLLYNANLSTKDKRALQAAIGKAEFNPSGNFEYNIKGPQKKKSDVNLFGVLSPFAELAVSEAGNKKVLDTTTEAVRKGSIGAMKSMPIKQYQMDYSALNPLVTEHDNQAAELWNHTSEVNKGLADSRLRIANNSNTASNIIKSAQTLSTQMGKHISDVDAQNLKLGLNYLENERQIADYNNNIAGTTAANILSKKAETIGKTFNNYTKTMAEFREDQDKYNAAKRTQGLYAELNHLSKKYTTATSAEEKKSILARMNAIRELIGHAGIYSRFTGKYALDTTWKS